MSEQPQGPDVVEIIGAGIAAVGVVAAWIRAGKSNATAANAVEVAKSARTTATKANGIAEEANDLARGANSISEKSAAAAEASAKDAKRSADIAERVEGRQIERNNVAWKIASKSAAGNWVATNTGLDTAYDAHVVLDVDGHRIVSESTSVQGGEDIVVDISAITKAKALRNRDTQQQMRAIGVNYYGSSSVGVKHLITWRTEQGSWHTKGHEEKA
ncbi:hypothetical protein [Paenarthrobacter nitroguajacolicus]|uniref:hypothetical protein n=1 Tax=Paenarthrobacter nitroguajacolicus TaxID=211146 RepID=UPI00248B4464|nr:hypothetical protein [Paenarthrobacter nitroguajacolicus]MDI2033012.1 hypothetical protein [Paenarthrobacter nitroguajacolicus]